jgi:putative SOS response-associated peptidase YedK
MCGRFTITVPAAEIAELMGLPELPAFAPRYNIKPTTPILTVREVDGKRVAKTPVWCFDPGWRTRLLVINAKVESIKTGRIKVSLPGLPPVRPANRVNARVNNYIA